MAKQYKGAQIKIKKKKKLLLEEVKKHGIVLHACRKVGIGSTTFYEWKKQDKKFAKNIESAIELGVDITNDMAVSILLREMNTGNIRALIFWLQHRHPDFNAAYMQKVLAIQPKTQEDDKGAVELTQEEEDKLHYVLKNLRKDRGERIAELKEKRARYEKEKHFLHPSNTVEDQDSKSDI